MQYWGVFVQPLLQWKSNKYYIFWVCICSLWYPANKAHAPYFIAICGLSGCTTFLHIISLTEWLSKKKLLNTECVLIVYKQKDNRVLVSRELLDRVTSEPNFLQRVITPSSKPTSKDIILGQLKTSRQLRRGLWTTSQVKTSPLLWRVAATLESLY